MSDRHGDILYVHQQMSRIVHPEYGCDRRRVCDVLVYDMVVSGWHVRLPEVVEWLQDGDQKSIERALARVDEMIVDVQKIHVLGR